ncbi:MAG: hypothetical protein EVJ46_06050 [Candidatus Acididesulfobacter guangdongensis]|jgi:hypothetical protein|uniref:Uncharacterized protein n=1 Tax=Acididesulfobacter guangdongensis TaxID=2597225 RepID=A0A519BH16_ACIG2|nr:MAG: hypothetical protein EVJ46_06050 [Candidatus Acididesulfobacter guangdongensis]
MKKNDIQNELSIEEKKKILLSAIEGAHPAKKKEALLIPFIPEIKLMLEKKMSLSAQLKALNSIGIKIAYKTYKSFLDMLLILHPFVKTNFLFYYFLLLILFYYHFNY